MQIEAQLSTYQFLSGRGKVIDFQRVQEIAKKYEAQFFNPNLFGEGYKYWFECRDQGNPFNSGIANAIKKELLRAGIELPGQ